MKTCLYYGLGIQTQDRIYRIIIIIGQGSADDGSSSKRCPPLPPFTTPVRVSQCDQIGQLLKFLLTNFLTKVAQICVVAFWATLIIPI